jgi:hypothetical protein
LLHEDAEQKYRGLEMDDDIYISDHLDILDNLLRNGSITREEFKRSRRHILHEHRKHHQLTGSRITRESVWALLRPKVGVISLCGLSVIVWLVHSGVRWPLT